MARNSDNLLRLRISAVSLVLAGVCFTLFPVLRPFFDESSLHGASQFASGRWVLAHSFGMAGFILLCLGFLGVYVRLKDTDVERRTFVAIVLSWVGAGLTLPFFGAEAFGLQVIGRTAMEQNNSALIPMINEVRFGPGIAFIGLGLLCLAAATVILATAIWKSGIFSKWSGIPLAVAFVVYIPQLQGAPLFQPIRIIVGLLILSGCIWTGFRLPVRSPAGVQSGGR